VRKPAGAAVIVPSPERGEGRARRAERKITPAPACVRISSRPRGHQATTSQHRAHLSKGPRCAYVWARYTLLGRRTWCRAKHWALAASPRAGRVAAV